MVRRNFQLKSYFICVEFQSAQIWVGSLKTVAGELATYKLDLEEVQARCDKDGPEQADSYSFFCGNGDGNYEIRP
jgi:hypothetical protein